MIIVQINENKNSDETVLLNGSQAVRQGMTKIQ